MWHCNKGHSGPRQMGHCHKGHSDPRQMWHCYIYKGHSDPRQMWHCNKGCHSSPESLLSQGAQPQPWITLVTRGTAEDQSPLSQGAQQQTSHPCHKGHSSRPVTLVTRGTAADQSPLSQGAQQQTSHPCHKGHSRGPVTLVTRGTAADQSPLSQGAQQRTSHPCHKGHSSRPQSVIAVITVLLKNKWFSRVLFNTSFHPTNTSAHAGCLKATSFHQAETATKLPLNPQQFLLKATQTQ